jgi:hypothetical protein
VSRTPPKHGVLDIPSESALIQHLAKSEQADLDLLEFALDSGIKLGLQLLSVTHDLLAVTDVDLDVFLGTILSFGKILICELVDAFEVGEMLRPSIDAVGGAFPDGSDGIAKAVLQHDALYQVAHSKREFLDKPTGEAIYEKIIFIEFE